MGAYQMLSTSQIEAAILEKKIKILGSFYYEGNTLTFCNEGKDILSEFLKGNLYSDRLKLTIGPVIKVLRKRSFNPKYRFKNLGECIDLRKTPNTSYVIKPRESIIVLTNEYIELNGDYAALIFPRVSLSDVGIVVTPAYIDPYYNGILRLHVANNSEYPFSLKILEPIAQCFFFKLSESISDTFKDNFSQKSVFVGQNWSSIINEERLPFPTKKRPKTSNQIIDTFKYQVANIGAFIRKHSLLAILIPNVIVLMTGYNSFLEYKSLTEQLIKNFEPASAEIIVAPGEIYGKKEIVMKTGKNEILTVLCNNNSVTSRIFSSDKENESRIVFSYKREKSTDEQYEVDFNYMVLRRIDN